MSELILVRHGQASFGAESYDQLSELGRQQVRILAEHWRSMGEQFDAIYSGSLNRQQQTAALLADVVTAPQPSIDPAFNEYAGEPLIRIYMRDHARFEGMPDHLDFRELDRKTFQVILEAAGRHWQAGTLQPAQTDVDFEPWPAFQRRVQQALQAVMARHRRGSRVIISTSGGVIALAVQYALELSDSQALAINWMVNNSSVTRLVYGRDRVSVGSFNSLAHLETPTGRELITFR